MLIYDCALTFQWLPVSLKYNPQSYVPKNKTVLWICLYLTIHQISVTMEIEAMHTKFPPRLLVYNLYQ